MIRRALSFLARTGPASPQDRWEEDAGLNAFTLAISIAALVAGAEFLDEPARFFATALADFWNARIEDWISVCNTPFGLQHGVSQYYMRAAPEEILMNRAAANRPIPIRNRSDGRAVPASEQVSVDFLQLVRFGLRTADHPAVLGSVKLIDALLRVDTPVGPFWHRYNEDGYGEHDDGSPHDGTGRGRPWPLLTGERGHFELCRGQDALPYLRAMAATASLGGMIPEQIWDAPDIPERMLYRMKPTGGATPLAWAHAEYLQLAASLRLGHPADRPRAVWERYRGLAPGTPGMFWCEHAPIRSIRQGARLYVCLQRSGAVRTTVDRAAVGLAMPTRDAGLGLHVVEMDVAGLRAGQVIGFDLRHAATDGWTEVLHEVQITEH